MSYYIRRIRLSDGKEAYTGPIRSPKQADKERRAWQEANWYAGVEESTPQLRRAVRQWQREADTRLGRR
jgi:hypothetical protein